MNGWVDRDLVAREIHEIFIIYNTLDAFKWLIEFIPQHYSLSSIFVIIVIKCIYLLSIMCVCRFFVVDGKTIFSFSVLH